MRVAVIGSRGWPFPEMVKQAIDDLPADAVVVSGGAAGADTMAAQFARDRGLEVIEYKADWGYGKMAGMHRNHQIIESADRVLAFHLDNSPGTLNSIVLARRAGKVVHKIVATRS